MTSSARGASSACAGFSPLCAAARISSATSSGGRSCSIRTCRAPAWRATTTWCASSAARSGRGGSMPRSPRSAAREGIAFPLRSHPPHAVLGRCAPAGALGGARPAAAPATVEALFSAYFTDGKDIGDSACWPRSPRPRAGRPARRALPAQRRRDGVGARRQSPRASAWHQRRPLLRRGGSHAIAGAQEPEVIERLLDVAAVEAAEVGAIG